MPETPDIPPAFDKRIVLLVTKGPYAGLHQINGTVAQALAEIGELPPFAAGIDMPPHQTRKGMASLVRVTHRFVLYKEINGPQMQRFDGFHEAQE